MKHSTKTTIKNENVNSCRLVGNPASLLQKGEKHNEHSYKTKYRNNRSSYDLFRLGENTHTKSTKTQCRTCILYKAKIIRLYNGSSWNNCAYLIRWGFYILADCVTFWNIFIIHKSKGFLSDEEIIENALDQEAQGIKPHYVWMDCKKIEPITPAEWLVWSVWDGGCGVFYRREDGKMIIVQGWQGDFLYI